MAHHAYPPRLVRILHAVDTGEISRAEAEQLLGFLQLVDARGPLPSRATWFRRRAQLLALGLRAPRTPAALRH